MKNNNSSSNFDVNIEREKEEIVESISERSGYQQNFTEKISESNLSRRKFIKALGLVGGGVVAGSMAISSSKILEIGEFSGKEEDDGDDSMISATGKSTHGSSDDSDPTGSEYTSQDHVIELEADGNRPVNYYFKVGETVADSSSTN